MLDQSINSYLSKSNSSCALNFQDLCLTSHFKLLEPMLHVVLQPFLQQPQRQLPLVSNRSGFIVRNKSTRVSFSARSRSRSSLVLRFCFHCSSSFFQFSCSMISCMVYSCSLLDKVSASVRSIFIQIDSP